MLFIKPSGLLSAVFVFESTPEGSVVLCREAADAVKCVVSKDLADFIHM